MDKTAWKGQCDRRPKPWGHELVWPALAQLHGKLLFVERGNRTSFKYHTHKNEVFYFVSGTAQVTYTDESWLRNKNNAPLRCEVFKPGDTLTVMAMCPYRIEAKDDCEIIEIGTLNNSPTVRLKDDYGRQLGQVYEASETIEVTDE